MENVLEHKVPNYQLTVDQVINTICENFNITREEFSEYRKKGHRADARRFFCAFMRKNTKLTLKQIGAAIRPKYHHATVIHMNEAHWGLVKYDKTYLNQVKGLFILLDEFSDGNPPILWYANN